MDIEDAQKAIEAGAEFLVSPILIPEAIDAAFYETNYTKNT